ncbi:MAG: polysaccharide deacetylase family protein [Planctomycetes bacterium]|nr:polysaccharide deacetylase family protein [Planctomycetota bacterium]MBU4398889.1 polysaccharide deacetylase family protein [Planctomycetota bacterium]MCG2683762.1 polysaccharide deacetylase family protein [Planctomycetales bacterium]
MPFWKLLLLNLYYHATRPARSWRNRKQAARGRSPAIVLYWHRIADDRATPWTASNATFVRQVSWLRKRFQLVSLAEAQHRIRQGYNHRPCVSVTFDDGYADNCRRAIPWLIEQQIPCTYFVTLRNVLEGEPFSHDLALGHRFEPNGMEQLRAMARAGVEIGAHTYTHPDLSSIADPRMLRREVVAAKEELQAALGRPVRYFAFPFGQYANLSPEAFETAKQAGYAAACSAYGGFNFPGDDPFHLQRIAVDDTMIRLKNWVTMDPRKLRTRRYEYQGFGSLAAASTRRQNDPKPGNSGSGIIVGGISETSCLIHDTSDH